MKFRSLVVIALIFALGLGAGMYLTKHPDAPQVMPTVKKADDEQNSTKRRLDINADISAEDIELVQGEGGEIQWKLKAAKAEYDKDKGLVLVTAPRLTTFVGDNRREIFVRSDFGEVDQKGNNLTLWDRVDGQYGLFGLKADSFDYIGSMNMIYIKGSVVVNRADMNISAPAVQINVTERTLEAAGGVEAYILVDELTDKDIGLTEQSTSGKE
ncbi:MAG: LPS export ABC transporter periplasmic protein LptC [Desulfovibrio sp.]